MDVNGIERRPGEGTGTYVSSLTAATIPPPVASSSPNSRKTANTAEQERDRQADEFKKSVTIIFWYKAKTEPIRLQQMIPSFPYFQLSRLSSLINDLGLSSNSYLDTYNPSSSQWEQHTINSVRVVESQQRLLYRMRKSLFEGLSEDDCAGLRDEVGLQRGGYIKPHTPQVLEPVSTPNLKRYASDALESSHPNKIHVSSSYYIDNTGDKVVQPPTSTSVPVSLPTPPSTSQTLPSSTSQDESNYIYRTQQQPQQQQQQQHQQQQQQQQQQQNYYASPAATPGTGIPSPYATTSDKDVPQHPVPVHYPPHPPLKRWPNDYTVYELTVGFNAMDQLIATSPAGDNMTQRVAFERIFGLRYVKSTVCRHRAIWKKADRTLRQQFEVLGTDQRACWGEFVRRVEGRPAGKPQSATTGSAGGTASASTAKLVPSGASALTIDFHYQNAEGGEAEGAEHAQGEGVVMESLQGSSLQGSGAMTNQGINVYDPGLAQHMSNNAHA